MKGYQAIPALLHRGGQHVVFSMLGGTNVPWIGYGVENGQLKLGRTRHEDTAVNAAAGYSRSTGSVGVCSVTRGPGFANCVNALIAAAYSHTPIMLVVAQSPTENKHTEQNVDQQGFTELIGAGFNHVASADELEGRYWTAMQRAQWNGCPQVLSIADGVLDAEVDLAQQQPPEKPPATVPNQESVAAAVDALERAERPLILAGRGAVLADCHQGLEELADLAGARVANTLRANRFFSGHPHDLGLCGTWSPPLAREALADADVVVAVGASLSHHTTAERQLWRGAKIIHCEVDVDRPVHASSPDLALLGDAGETTRALITEWRRRGLPRKPVTGPLPDMKDIRASLLDIDMNHDPARGMDVRRAYAGFNDLLPEDRIVVTDAGGHGAPMQSLLDARDARSWVLGRGYGSTGLGLGTAIGAATAHPERPVVLFCGDGGFMMASHDLDAVGLNDLNLTVVILNDEQLGSELRYLTKYRLPYDTVRQSLPDIPTLAGAFGGTGVVVRTEEELARLELTYSGLTIVDVRIDPEVVGNTVFY